MPVKSTKVVNEQQVEVQTAVDCDGSELQIGDYVTIRLKVTGIRPIAHPHTGLEHRQDVELGRPILVPGSGEYVDHFLVCDSGICSKSD